MNSIGFYKSCLGDTYIKRNGLDNSEITFNKEEGKILMYGDYNGTLSFTVKELEIILNTAKGLFERELKGGNMKNEIEKDKIECCKIKLFSSNSDCGKGENDNIENEINDFIKDKILVDIKMAEMGMAGDGGHASDRTILVVYKDKK